MQVTGEIRWFWRDYESRRFVDWFVEPHFHGGAPAVPPVRIDRYLDDPSSTELGIKARGGRDGVEIKGLVDGCAAVLAVAPFAGPIEIWSKWWTPALSLDATRTVAVEKQRWVRAFDMTGESPMDATIHVAAWLSGARPMPIRGCNCEVVRIIASDGQVWWTLGFEAYGSLATVSTDVAAAATSIASRRPPAMPVTACQSYPAWLGSTVPAR